MITIPGVEPFWMWAGFIVLVLILLWLDLSVFYGKDHVVKVRESLLLTAFWIFIAMIFNALIYFQFGAEAGLEFLTGYLLEKSLSMDNLFVFLLIFAAFNIPRIYQHRVLLWGIIGAVVMRGVFIGAGAALVQRFDWIFFFFGAILLYSAYRMQFQKERKFDPDTSFAVKIARKVLPVTSEVHGHDFFVKKNGKWFATILFITLITIEMSDVVFAMDSIPAIFAITTDPFIVFTSNIFAILGLRALYFAIAGLHSMFVYLKTGLAVILGFIGVKLIVYKWVHVPVLYSLTFILIVLAISIVASVLVGKPNELHSDDPAYDVKKKDHKVSVKVTRKGKK